MWGCPIKHSVAVALWLHLTQAEGSQAWDFPLPNPEALSQWKPQVAAEAPRCGPFKELGPDVMWQRQWWGLGSAELSSRPEVQGVELSEAPE